MLNFFRNSFKKEHLFLSLFLFLGLVFVSEIIGLLDFWLDEAAVHIAIKNSFANLGPITAQYAQQFLHNFAVKTWTIFFGDSPVAMRSFSAFCYFLLILVSYKAGSVFFQNKKVGLLTAFLLTTNYFAIWYAIEVKAYTLAALMGLSAFYFFIQATRKATKKNYFLYWLFSALGFYSHPWTILIFGSQALSLLLFWKHFQKPWRLLFVQFLIFLASLPFLFLTLSQGSLGVNSYAGTVSWAVIPQSFLYLSFGAFWPYLFFTLIASLFVFGQSALFQRIFKKDSSASSNFSENSLATKTFSKPFNPPQPIKNTPSLFSQEEKRMNIMLSLYLFVPLILAAGVSHFTSAYVLGRYEMTVLPAFLLLLANLWFKIKEPSWLFLIGVVLLYTSFTSVSIYRKTTLAYRSSDRTVINEIYSRANDEDYLVTTDLSWATAYYFSHTIEREKKLNLAAYPSQIEQQVVWSNQKEMNRPENRERYQKEVEALVDQIKNNSQAETIFVLYKGGSAINALLKEKLDQNFEFIEEYYPEGPREAAWYDYTLIYKKLKNN